MATRFDAVVGQPVDLTYQYYVNNTLATPFQFQKVDIFRIDSQVPGGAVHVQTIPTGSIVETSTGKFSYTMASVGIPGTYFDRVTIIPTTPTAPDVTVTVSSNLSLDEADWFTDRFINIPNGLNIDGHSLADTDTVLLFNQINPAHNGLYVYSSSAEELTRIPAYDAALELTLGLVIQISQGARAGNKYRLSVNPTILNTDPIRFTYFTDPIFVDQISFEVYSAAPSITGTVVPSLVPVCRVYGQILRPNGTPMIGTLVSASIGQFPARLNTTAYAVGQEYITTFTNPLGQFYIDMPKGIELRFIIRDILLDTYVAIPDADSVNLFTLTETKDIGDVTSNDVTSGQSNW